MPTAHERIRTILDAHGISHSDIDDRMRVPNSRPASCDLGASQFGARVVAAMLELLVERLTQPGMVGDAGAVTTTPR